MLWCRSTSAAAQDRGKYGRMETVVFWFCCCGAPLLPVTTWLRGVEKLTGVSPSLLDWQGSSNQVSKRERPAEPSDMNAFYNIPAAVSAQRDQTKALAAAARAAWQSAQDAEEENEVLAELWENYEEIRGVDQEALWTLQQAWLDARHAQAAPAEPAAGRSVEQYEESARVFRMRAEIDRAIMDAYIELGYGPAAWNPFWEERGRMEGFADLCEGYVAARREQAEAEAERERLLVEWGRMPVAERKSSHPNFRARVDCCRRSEEARQRWFLSPLCAHELPVEARRLWLAMEPALHIARQMAGGVGGVVAADMRRRCAEAGEVGEAVLRYAGLA